MNSGIAGSANSKVLQPPPPPPQASKGKDQAGQTVEAWRKVEKKNTKKREKSKSAGQ